MLAIAITIAGIYVLFKGDVAFTANKVVKGWRARVIGAVLCSYFPLALMMGFCLGIYFAMQQREFPAQYALFIDLGLIAFDVLVAVMLGLLWGKPRAEWDADAQQGMGYTQGFTPPGNQFGDVNFPPPNKDNPYEPPFTR